MKVEQTKDELAAVLQSIHSLVGKQVLVGIPEDKSDREDGAPISNAEIGYIAENGAPGANVPARPWLAPGIQDAEPAISRDMEKAVNAAIDKKSAAVDAALNAAGLAGQSAAKAKIRSGDFAPLSPRTVAARYRARGSASRRKSEKAYMELARAAAASGMSLADVQSAAGIKPLINSGDFLNSISYVVKAT